MLHALAPRSVGVVPTGCLGGVGVRSMGVVPPRSVGVMPTGCLGGVWARLVIALDVARHSVLVQYLQLRQERGL